MLSLFTTVLAWAQDANQQYQDALLFEDLRPVARDYVHKCHLRLNRHLSARKGKYFMDVASGPIQYQEYLTYSAGFERRLCVDISFSALEQAQRKLGDRGLFLLADITNLPLQAGVIDGAVSLHTIYHVPADEQDRAFNEIHRVLSPGARAAIVYSWGGQALGMRVALFPIKLALNIGRTLLSLFKIGKKKEPLLYFHPQPYRWFKSKDWAFKYDIVVWRSLNLTFLRLYIHKYLGGKSILQLIYWIEERLPHVAG